MEKIEVLTSPIRSSSFYDFSNLSYDQLENRERMKQQHRKLNATESCTSSQGSLYRNTYISKKELKSFTNYNTVTDFWKKWPSRLKMVLNHSKTDNSYFIG